MLQTVLHVAAMLISNHEGSRKLPLQFHTGLGDNDINLSRSSPALLQNFVKVYPKLRIVLLHASYPFTREAGYLASVYENVYMDIGEVFRKSHSYSQHIMYSLLISYTSNGKPRWPGTSIERSTRVVPYVKADTYFNLILLVTLLILSQVDVEYRWPLVIPVRFLLNTTLI